MNPHPVLEKSVNLLLNHSLQAGVLVLLVLLVQWMFRQRLTPRWRFALWWIVLVRLLLPIGPESAVSVFNFIRPSVSLEGPRHAQVSAAASIPMNGDVTPYRTALSEPLDAIRPIEHSPFVGNTVADPALPAVTLRLQPNALSFDDFLLPGIALLWLVGVLALSGWTSMQVVRLRRRLSVFATPVDPALAAILDDCRRIFGVTRSIELIETNAVASPALFGLFRLRLLLPRGFGDQFSPSELRHIFLHEVAHVKRGDLWLNWLVTVLQIVHWFNPLLWFGLARLRADRELACDELALLHSGDEAATSYGETVIKLLEGLSRPAAIPGVVGILEDKVQMRRRISMIANFHKPGRWSALALFLVAGVAVAALTDAQSDKSAKHVGKDSADIGPTLATNVETAYQPVFAAVNSTPKALVSNVEVRPDLNGQVSTKDGNPLPATVFIATAAPKTGTSSFCPSCYADCAKHAKADAAGLFTIPSLDPQLTFRVLAVAKGYKPKYVSKVDPTKGPVQIELEPIESADASPDRSLRGRVVDAGGEPIEGAVVEMQGIRFRDGGGRQGAVKGVDPLAVTDQSGEFLITSKDPFEGMDVKVEARAFAPKNINHLASGGEKHVLRLSEGAMVKGRVVLDGKPPSGISVGISGADRGTGSYLGHYEVGTDAKGAFTFFNVPPDADFLIYGLMGTMAQYGTVALKHFHSAQDGDTTDLGDLIIRPGHRLAGQVVLADGNRIPAETRLLVSRDEAWDSVQLTLDENGRFELTGVPSEIISLSVRIKGYRVAGRNASLDTLNPFRLIGHVKGDVTNLVFLLEKGDLLPPNYNVSGPESEWPRNRPLRGAEAVSDLSREWTLSGHVIDRDTRLPIEHFRVTPGQIDQFSRTNWDPTHAVDCTNGTFLTYISRHTPRPMLKVDADGYLPDVAKPRPADATNVDFNLKKGHGAEGTVLTPDGNPATGATLILIGDEFYQAGFNSSGELYAYYDKSRESKADSRGHFEFKPEWGTRWVAAASSNGFAVVSIESLATNSIITLESYGRISGTLKRTSGPGTNEHLDLAFAEGPQINLGKHTVTDTEGHFKFDQVPAGHLRISYRTPVSDRGAWQNHPLREVKLKPGQSLEVSVDTTDRPNPQVVVSHPTPQPKRILGPEVKGIVLSPNGKRATDAEVALQVEGKFLSLGKASFVNSSSLRGEGLIVDTRSDGSFTLPLYEGARSVIALNEHGFAQVSLDQFKQSPQITLQRWGIIKGTLRVGHHPGTNVQVILSTPPPQWTNMTVRKAGQKTNDLQIIQTAQASLQPPVYDLNAFKATTDDQGRFVLTYVPPGQLTLARLIPSGPGSWIHRRLGVADVKAGETTTVTFGGEGQTVIAKLVLPATNSTFDFESARATVQTPTAKILARMQQCKTPEEFKAFRESEEFQTAMSHFHGYPATVAADGLLRVEDLPPGKYEITLQPIQQTSQPSGGALTLLRSADEFLVGNLKEDGKDAPVDLGTVEMRPLALRIPAE